MKKLLIFLTIAFFACQKQTPIVPIVSEIISETTEEEQVWFDVPDSGFASLDGEAGGGEAYVTLNKWSCTFHVDGLASGYVCTCLEFGRVNGRWKWRVAPAGLCIGCPHNH